MKPRVHPVAARIARGCGEGLVLKRRFTRKMWAQLLAAFNSSAEPPPNPNVEWLKAELARRYEGPA